MELHQLRYFCAIAETGSFSRAAGKTHVSQPSLSQQVRKLEDELGVRLFDRLARSVRLTLPGRIFLPRARAILLEIESARNEVQEGTGCTSGTVCVGAIPTIAPYYLAERVAAFSSKYPQACVKVVEEITPLLLEALRSGNVDLAVLALPVPVRSHEFVTFPVLTERLNAVLPKGHRLAAHQQISLAELRREPFLLLRDGHCFRDTAVEACKRARLNPQVVFESGQFSSILAMVSAGVGVSVVPDMAVDRSVPGCAFVPIGDDRAVRTIGVAMLRGRMLTRVQTGFVELLHAESQSNGHAYSEARKRQEERVRAQRF